MRSPLPRRFAVAATVAAVVFVSLAPAATRGWQPGETSVREAQNRVALGLNHSCVALYDGTVRCWGNNLLGQLGNNTTVNSALPVTVQRSGVSAFRPGQPLGSVTAVAAGTGFSCALTAGGTVFCWGRSDSGQLGNLSNTTKTQAVSVLNLSSVVRIAAGDDHACALLANGSVKCWGRNQAGQLGTGQTVNAFLPATVIGLAGVIDIAAGSAHTCALIAGGTAKCWGSNQFGQLGTANNTNSLTPVAVFNLTDAYSLTAGGEHTCAISNRFTQCWGRNTEGQLGNGDFTNRSAPVNAIQTNITSIRAGRLHTCAVTSAGLVRCWGRNAAGQLGNGNTIVQPVPTGGSGLSLMTAAAAGGDHSCAMKADGTVACWGAGSFGQLGNGGTVNITAPAPVTGVAGSISAKAAAVGKEHTCALRSNGTVSCWGHNEGLLLGNGSPAPTIATPTAVNGLNGVTAVSAGSRHTCALIADGTVKCWGGNFLGQVGNGTNTNQPTPVTVPGLTDVVSVATGDLHTCALTVAGTIFCWGNNGFGQLGTGGTAELLSPTTTVIGQNKAVGLAAGFAHTCALAADGPVFCWGFGIGVGNGSAVGANVIPVSVPGLLKMTSVAAGGRHSCAIDDGGVSRCWGDNSRGEIGNGTAGNEQLFPSVVTGFNSGIQFAANEDDTCAIDVSGDLSCWGDNGSGTLGIGSFDTVAHPTPAPVPGVSGVTGAAVGASGTACATVADGALLCWGDNLFGSVGDGSGANKRSPVAVPSFTLNIVPVVQLASPNGRKLTVNIVANCEEGEKLKLLVEVRQPGGAAGHGNETATCAGTLATFPVEVNAQGRLPFASGAATVDAGAEIGNGGGGRSVQTWTRAVQIVD